MTPSLKFPKLPFLVRQMLAFSHKAAFDLELESVSTVAAEVFIRGITREGLINFSDTHTGDGALESATFRIPDIPISASVHTVNAAVERGDYWVRLWLRSNQERIMMLCQGYVSRQSAPAWPRAQADSELIGGGKFKLVTQANPAAAADFTTTVPAGEHWILHFVRFDFAADGTGGTRTFILELDPTAGGQALSAFARATSAANESYEIAAAPFGFEDGGAYASIIELPIPPNMHIPSGGTIASAIDNIKAGDQISNIRLYVEQYLEL